MFEERGTRTTAVLEWYHYYCLNGIQMPVIFYRLVRTDVKVVRHALRYTVTFFSPTSTNMERAAAPVKLAKAGFI